MYAVYCGVPLREWCTPKFQVILECWIGVPIHLVECGMSGMVECRIALQQGKLQQGEYKQSKTIFHSICTSSHAH